MVYIINMSQKNQEMVICVLRILSLKNEIGIKNDDLVSFSDRLEI